MPWDEAVVTSSLPGSLRSVRPLRPHTWGTRGSACPCRLHSELSSGLGVQPWPELSVDHRRQGQHAGPEPLLLDARVAGC